MSFKGTRLELVRSICSWWDLLRAQKTIRTTT